MSAGSNDIRHGKPKTKTFSGCWTCRRRKVKCDNIHPICRRCVNSGLDCEGFATQLHWLVPGAMIFRSASTAKRRTIQRDEAIPLVLYADAADQMLEDIEKAADSTVVGPFTVFRASRIPISLPMEDTRMSFKTAEEQQRNIASTPFLQRVSDQSPTQQRSATVKFSVEKVGTEKYVPSIYYGTTNTIKAVSPRYDSLEFTYTGGHSTMLLSHYANTVTKLLQPIQHHSNPYRSIYMPLAIVGSEQIFIGSLANIGSNSTSYRAVYHALSSAAAFHLLHKCEASGQARYNRLAIFHKANAFHNLRLAIAAPYDIQSYSSILAAMLAMVTIDVMEGGMMEFPIHLRGFRNFNKSHHDRLDTIPSIRRLISTYRFLHMLAATTDYRLPPKPWPMGIKSECAYFGGVGSSPVNEGSLEFSYGITSKIACIISRTTELSQYLSYHSTTDLDGPPEKLRQACHDLGNSLTSWSLADESFSSSDFADNVTRNLMQYFTLAFFNAARLYYHRRISLCSASELASLARAVAVNLEAAENLKLRSYADSEYIMAPVMWAGFVASCEASIDDRVIWKKWWARTLRFGIGNIARLWTIVEDIWHAQDEGGDEFGGWIQHVRSKAIQVLIV